MNAIGGYIELEQFRGNCYHDNAICLNTGRNALRYLIRTQNIRKIYLPFLCCEAVLKVCEQENVELGFYPIDRSFYPIWNRKIENDERIYLINYYGMFSNEEIAKHFSEYGKIIIDNVQDFFQKPTEGVDTLYSCRKFFGVPDGGFLYTDKEGGSLEQDSSSERMKHLLGRYEYDAERYYSEYRKNENTLDSLPVQMMSKLTYNLLHGIDYQYICHRRTRNFSYLQERLGMANEIDLPIISGAYAYPFLCKNGAALRDELRKKQIFIPVLWPNVLETQAKDSIEYYFAINILPLPVDQRYNEKGMQIIVDSVNSFLTKSNERN